MSLLKVYQPNYPTEPPFDAKRCAHSVFDGLGFRTRQCQRSIKIEEEGYGWCRQHAPSRKRELAEQQQARWEREGAAQKARSDLRAINWAIEFLNDTVEDTKESMLKQLYDKRQEAEKVIRS